MGYYMKQRASKFFIAAKDKPAALQAVKAAENLWCLPSSILRAAKCLEYVMENARWHLKTNLSDGNVEGISFAGEQFVGDNFLFAAIAPFVKAGSYIEMSGEGDAVWRWFFDGRICVEQEATYVFN